MTIPFCFALDDMKSKLTLPMIAWSSKVIGKWKTSHFSFTLRQSCKNLKFGFTVENITLISAYSDGFRIF